MKVIEHKDDCSRDDRLRLASSIELFAGGGGLALGMEAAGFHHVLAVERDDRACSTLLANAARPLDAGENLYFPIGRRWPLAQADVRDVDFSRWRGAVAVLAGGVPCQPWSVAGMHKGYDDQRNLWPEFVRCLRETSPQAIVAENVRGLLRPSFRPYYEYILRSLAAPCEVHADGEGWHEHDQRLKHVLRQSPADPAERYDVTFRMVNAADYGVPQIRWRVFIVAFRHDLGIGGWEFPRPTHAKAVLLRSQASAEYWERHGIKRPDMAAARLPGFEEELAPWRTLRDAIGTCRSRRSALSIRTGSITSAAWALTSTPGIPPMSSIAPRKQSRQASTGYPGAKGSSAWTTARSGI